jgi:hypothetical protein
VAGIFFLALLSVCMSVGNSFGLFIFFITDRHGDEIRITDAHDSDEFVSSEIPSVIISPTVCVPFTDGINPSVKLYNDVVISNIKSYNQQHDPPFPSPIPSSSFPFLST